MQRLLSLIVIGALGGLGWMFLSGSDFHDAGQSGAFPGAIPTAGNWPSSPWTGGSTASGGVTSPPTPTGYQAGYPQTAPPVLGSAAPPTDVGPTVRLASYNIEVFGKTKLEKPEIAQTLAEIVRQFDVVAVQEIRTKDDYFLPRFLSLVNATGRRYDFVIGRRLGVTVSTEQYAFIYDSDRIEVDRQSVYTLGDPDNLLHREPLVANFRARGVSPDEAFTFTLVNVHVDPDITSQELDALAEAYRAIRRAGQEDDVIMLGDYNVDDQRLGRLGQIPGILPLIRGVFTNTRQNRLYDNLILHQPSTTEFTGRSGVFDVMRLFNLALAQAEQVSDHFPVWAEFSAYERDYAWRIASRRAAVR